ncbi:CofH family radical SAM protein [Candidatus Sumerlaeota bacterium]|nr:CofH family radical SAM protein [Candidatus Sumerlaeota bacterium]
MTRDQAAQLLAQGDLIDLGRAANDMRMRLHPDPIVTYAIDRNINTTNECVSLCEFCAFAREPSASEAWTLDRDAIAAKIEELCACGGRQILLQGGLSPRLDLAWYENLFRWMRERWPDLHIHALSPPEIKHLASGAGIGWRETITRLRAAGLDSIPGGGAEILSDRVRAALSPRKCTADEWIGVMRAAHEEGLRTSATMVVGLGETPAERAEHFDRIRALQDETGGFTAFIVWTFQPGATRLARRAEEEVDGVDSVNGVDKEKKEDMSPGVLGAGAWDYLRTLAVARLYLDNVANLQASWVTQGDDIAQLALLFGANDLGSTMLEENVVAAAGTRFRMGIDDFERLAADLGMRVVERDFFYRPRSEFGKI